VDVRSLRYPGIISWKTKPGGGTTDYAVDIYFKALENKQFTCFLSENTRLPMMYMQDAVNATIQIMQAKSTDVKIRTSYNLSAIDFTPKEIADEIKKHIPDFKIDYEPDSRQQIADSWPSSIDDTEARNDWNWKHQFDLSSMTTEMLENLSKKES
ncbi:MAG: NAD-dependent epimerase, partial [Polaribacter sp.]|nr:NAD-dependent epimerase [Polaribacter sp.]